MKQKQLRDALFTKILKFDEQQLSDLLFAANCIESGIEVYKIKNLENQKLSLENQELKETVALATRELRRYRQAGALLTDITGEKS